MVGCVSISRGSFAFVADLSRRETAMVYETGKEYLVEARLLPLAREAGCADVDAYVARLRSDRSEQARALDALTINETSWFRDRAPFDAFVEVMLPDLLRRRSASRKLRIWSAACSSGQEAYSLAMLLEDHLPADWNASILATDVSPTMVERVRSGRYSQVEIDRGLPADLRARHFTRDGTGWRVSGRLRSRVEARSLNLAAPFGELSSFDVVLLRNVLIYFDAQTRREVLRRMHDTLAPDGYLLLGAAETGLDMGGQWTRELAGRVQLHRPARTPALAATRGA